MEAVMRTTLPDGRTVKSERGRKSAGQYLRVTVFAKTNRIVGVAEIQIPLMDGITLETKIGAAAAKAIEDDLQAIAMKVADAVQANFVGASQE